MSDCLNQQNHIRNKQDWIAQAVLDIHEDNPTNVNIYILEFIRTTLQLNNSTEYEDSIESLKYMWRSTVDSSQLQTLKKDSNDIQKKSKKRKERSNDSGSKKKKAIEKKMRP